MVPGKCSRLLARNVGKSATCLSNQPRENQSIVMSVSRSTRSQDIKALVVINASEKLYEILPVYRLFPLVRSRILGKEWHREVLFSAGD